MGNILLRENGRLQGANLTIDGVRSTQERCIVGLAPCGRPFGLNSMPLVDTVEEIMKLALLPLSLTICRLAPNTEIPAWALQNRSLLSITYTSDELSIVCPASVVPQGVRSETNWRAIKVQGMLDFSLTGILASLAAPLASANIPLFAISTFDTDYILVKEQHIEHAKSILEQSGHTFEA